MTLLTAGLGFKVCRFWVIAHEFGHAVGMQHVHNNSIMVGNIIFKALPEGSRVDTDTTFYADSSFSQTAIRKPINK